MNAARIAGQIVMTQDLDFSVLLATSHASGPSVIQIRARGTMPHHISGIIAASLSRYEQELIQGAILVIDDYQ